MSWTEANRWAARTLTAAALRKEIHGDMLRLADAGLDDSEGYRAGGRALQQYTQYLVAARAANPIAN